MIERTFDVEWVDALVSELWSYVSEDGQQLVTAAPWVEDERNYFWKCGQGAFVCTYIDHVTYEIHTLFRPRQGASSYGRQMIFNMFTQTACEELLTKCPENNVLAARLAERCGFRYQYSGKLWHAAGLTCPMRHYSQRIEDWILTEPRLIEYGQRFHDRLVELGVEVDHDEDLIHDRYVGASVAMTNGGQFIKGVTYYNRWAKIYGALPVGVISENPPSIDISTAALTFKEGGDLCLWAQL